GGRVVAVNPRRHRRHHAETVEALERLLEGSEAERLMDRLARAPLRAQDVAATMLLSPDDAAGLVGELEGAGDIAVQDGWLMAAGWRASTARSLLHAAHEYLAAHRLRRGVPREQLRSRF